MLKAVIWHLSANQVTFHTNPILSLRRCDVDAKNGPKSVLCVWMNVTIDGILNSDANVDINATCERAFII